MRNNLLTSGLYFYLYNEMSTLTIKKTNAVTQSVANTAKRVIVIVGVAIVMGESLNPMKLIGCTIGTGRAIMAQFCARTPLTCLPLPQASAASSSTRSSTTSSPR